MATNSFGLDSHYFADKLGLVLRDLGHFTPEELARALARLARTACDEVLGEAEFASMDASDELVVWRITLASGESCHFGTEAMARAWGRGEGKIERVELKAPTELRAVAPVLAAQEPVACVLDEAAAHNMGAIGAEPTEPERRLFEAWMRGHCWAVVGEWDGRTYIASGERGGQVDHGAMLTRKLWAAWRDRAALAGYTAPPAAEQPYSTTSDRYRAELYDEVWEKARALGYGNVTMALAELERLRAAEQTDTVRDLLKRYFEAVDRFEREGPVSLAVSAAKEADALEKELRALLGKDGEV